MGLGWWAVYELFHCAQTARILVSGLETLSMVLPVLSSHRKARHEAGNCMSGLLAQLKTMSVLHADAERLARRDSLR